MVHPKISSRSSIRYHAVMPRALAIETSGRTGSLALVENGHLVAEDQFPHGLRHAAEIVTRIDALCQAAHRAPRDLEELYVSVGPGSFTGLRIGVTLAKTLAFATGARLVAVPSVEVLARNAPRGWQNAVIVLDAKRGQIFTARFVNRDGQLVEAEAAHLDTLTAMLERSPRPVCLIGEGIPFHERFIPPGTPGVTLTPPELWQARRRRLPTSARGWHGRGSLYRRTGSRPCTCGSRKPKKSLRSACGSVR